MSDKTITVRYAPYLENAHSQFLSIAMAEAVDTVRDNPYSDYTPVNPDDAFFIAGYTIASFPSLMDMFGKFMAGIDVEQVQATILTKLDSASRQEYRNQTSLGITEEIDMSSAATLSLSARELNIVNSTTFVIGLAQIESAKVKEVTKLSTELITSSVDYIQKCFDNLLNWLKTVIVSYAMYIKSYYTAKSQADTTNGQYEMLARLWPLTILDYIRAYLNALGSARAMITKETRRKRSVISGILLVASDTITGAYIGSMIAGPVGAVIGGVVGFVVGVASWIFE